MDLVKAKPWNTVGLEDIFKQKAGPSTCFSLERSFMKNNPGGSPVYKTP